MRTFHSEEIPESMKRERRWCLWKFDKKKGKIPFQTNGQNAASNNPATWTTFDAASEALATGKFSGLGYMLYGGDVTAIDLDHCGENPAPWAAEIINAFRAKTYVELSPSGEGYHIFCKGRKGVKSCKKALPQYGEKAGIEIYDGVDRRFFTVTGANIGARELGDCQPEIDAQVEKHFGRADEPRPVTAVTDAPAMFDDVADEEIIGKIMRHRAVPELWAGGGDGGDESRGDLALCNHIALYTENADQIDRIFRASGRVREKWQKRKDYRDLTIGKAIEGVALKRAQIREESSLAVEMGHSAKADAASDKVYDAEAIKSMDVGELFSDAFIAFIAKQPDDAPAGAAARERARKLHELTNFKEAVKKRRQKINAARVKQLGPGNAEDERRPAKRKMVDFGENMPLRGALFVTDDDYWVTSPNKGLFYRKYTPNGDTKEIRVSSPIVPVARYISLDEFAEVKERIELAFMQDGKWGRLLLPKGTVQDTRGLAKILGNNKITVNPTEAKFLAKFFTDILIDNESVLPKYVTVEQAGWWNDKFIPVSDEYRPLCGSDMSRVIDAIKPTGDARDWFDVIGAEWAENIILRVFMDAAAASPLLYHINGQNFFCHLWGRTGLGKSVALKIAASMYGDPSELVRSLNSTTMGREAVLVALRHLPAFFDEMQTLNNQTLNATNMIHDATEGIERTRADTLGDARMARRWQLTILTTGESEIFDVNAGAGAKNRVVDIEIKEPLFTDYGRLINTLEKTNGHFLPLLIKNLPDGDYLHAKYQENIKAIIAAGEASDKATTKQAAALAAILLADEISRPILNPTARPLTAADVAKFAKTELDVSIAERAYRAVMDEIGINARNFIRPAGLVISGFDGEIVDDEADDKPSTTINAMWGRISENEILFIRTALDAVLEKHKATFNAVKREWAAKGYIVKWENGRYDCLRRINGTVTRIVKFAVTTFSEKT